MSGDVRGEVYRSKAIPELQDEYSYDDIQGLILAFLSILPRKTQGKTG